MPSQAGQRERGCFLSRRTRRQGLRRGVVVLDTKREGRRRSSDVPVRSYGSGRALHAQASCDLWRLYAVDGHCRKARQDFLARGDAVVLCARGQVVLVALTGPVLARRPGDGVGIRRAAGLPCAAVATASGAWRAWRSCRASNSVPRHAWAGASLCRRVVNHGTRSRLRSPGWKG